MCASQVHGRSKAEYEAAVGYTDRTLFATAEVSRPINAIRA